MSALLVTEHCLNTTILSLDMKQYRYSYRDRYGTRQLWHKHCGESDKIGLKDSDSNNTVHG